MKYVNLFLSLVLVLGLLSSCKSKNKPAKEEAPAAEGWVSLFDGKTSTGWRGYNSPAFPNAYWEIVDGCFHCLGLGKGEMTNTDLITEKKYSNFELSLEWNISPGGNSGIFIFAQEIPGKPIYMSAPEMQVIDNQNHPDAKLGVNGNRQAGSLYDMIPAVPQNAKPAGEWNQVNILSDNGRVVFKLNGENVVTFTLGTDEWKQMCANSKFKDWEWFVNTAKEGHIALQDHGFEVWYRNIKIREL
jgi:hypothetical protein